MAINQRFEDWFDPYNVEQQKAYDLLKRNWPAPYTNYDEANQVVYEWVKKDKISPEQMAELIVINYKSFCY